MIGNRTDRREWLQEKRQEVRRLGDVATNAIVPSRRDFTQFIASQRADLALVPRLKRRDPRTGGAWPAIDVVALARALDDTDVAALAVATAVLHGASASDLETVRAAVGAPLLRDDLCIDEAQLYDSRLRGADAVRIPVADLTAGELDRLCDIAVSLHITPVLEIGGRDDLEAAPVRAPHCIGLDCPSRDGFADIDATRALATLVPAHFVVIALAEPRSLDEALRLRGHVDAVVVGDALLAAVRPAAEIARFLGG
jgi:indole-3-glycerol phosphate synthase